MDLSMLPDFIVEASEHLEEMENSLLQLEEDQGNRDILNEIFRAIHSIKGAAQYIGLERVSGLSHKLESLLDTIRQGDKQLNANIIDLFIVAKDRINSLVNELDNNQTEETEIDDLLQRITEALEAPGQNGNQSTLKEDSNAKRQSPVKAGNLEKESLEEEYDEELLDIFMQQLKENVSFLQTQIAELDSSFDKSTVLNRCSATIKSLHSSANYMSYYQLCEHYKAWQDEIDSAIETVSSSGDEAELSFMQEYVDSIVRAYPQVAVDKDQSQVEMQVSASEDNIVTDPKNDNLDGTLDALFGESIEDSSTQEQGEAVHFGDWPEEVTEELQPALSDAFDVKADTPVPIGEVAPLENESLNEEYDEELLSIFLHQLKENIGFLQTQIADLDSSFDKKAALNRCRATINDLHSSANYMGYEKLCGHYKSWQNKIDSAIEETSSGIETELGFMQRHFDTIIRAYPQAAADMDQRQMEQPESAAKDDTVADSTPGNEKDILDSIFSKSFDDSVTDAQEGIFFDSEEPADVPSSTDSLSSDSSGTTDQARELFSGSEEEPAAPSSTDGLTDQLLFGKLQDALKVSLDEHEDVPVKHMHSVIEEMISTSSERGVAKQTTAEETVPEKAVSPIISVSSTELKETTPSDEADELSDPQLVLHEAEQRPAQRPDKDSTGARKVKQSMRVDADKIDYLINQVGELVVSRAYFAQLFNEIKTMQQGLLENTGLTKNELKPLNEFSFRLGEAGIALGRVSNELQEAVMKVRMLPISQLFKRYPRLVRDLVKNSEKQVALEIRGEETELDKMVIEEISDPLIHIIRNAVDHGIETVSERKQLGKPEQGTLTLEAYHESNHIVIEITDDGKGIDPERIKVKARDKGLYSEEELERMSTWELTRLIMLPGFSTAEKASETSGRGVGMDVVRKNIEKLNGTIDIDSEVGQQTRLRIKIPLTLAIIQALMVKVNQETFTIPLTTVEETLRIFQHEISEIEGVEVIHLRDATMPIFRLSKIFNVRKNSEDSAENKFFVVVVSTGMQEVGLIVDELLGQEEVVIKPLADYLRVESGFSGATIIGDGAISLILDIPELIKMTTEQQALKQKGLAVKRKTKGAEMPEQQTPTIH